MSLKISRLTKYFDEKCILENFSYEFKQTGLYLLTGESGRGKTTLLRMIAGLDKKYEGEITGGGIGQVGFVFQEYRLFPHLSAIDNVIYAISDRKNEAVTSKAANMLKRLGFEEKDFSLNPSELSGGMKQRVSLARAFLSRYPILLLDEPTKELDRTNLERVKEIIRELSESRLIILVSHVSEDTDNPDAEIINLDFYAE